MRFVHTYAFRALYTRDKGQEGAKKERPAWPIGIFRSTESVLPARLSPWHRCRLSAFLSPSSIFPVFFFSSFLLFSFPSFAVFAFASLPTSLQRVPNSCINIRHALIAFTLPPSSLSFSLGAVVWLLAFNLILHILFALLSYRIVGQRQILTSDIERDALIKSRNVDFSRISVVHPALSFVFTFK